MAFCLARLEDTMRHLSVLAVAGSAAMCAACTTPYSQLYGTRYYRTPIDTYPVAVISVDGEHFLREPVQIDPGLRRVTVQGPPTVAQHYGRQQTITLDVKPCTRYYLVAQKANRLSSQYSVMVDHEEPVPGCARPG
jgi:hypothetical protein